ncbi:NUDIX hydrolase [Acidisoma silvae]|uniref:NUDIX domain-containing protein n=1 Tax=Acidisoma silvae TaxID=2802396 RepID=A0A963YR08_9PROT|nr:NUDIX domain-containing protein [Acidisoma silvae]MCB8875546.1 NUDIX domain-containing protein [Acidisoma silvae]
MADRVADFFLRHITSSRTATLPGGRLPFRVGALAVGWLKPDFAQIFAQTAGLTPDEGGGITLPDARVAELPALAQAIGESGRYRLRGEMFDVRAGEEGPAITMLDRGAVPSFGIVSHGVHCNGLVERPDGLHIWVARRSATKLLDPGKLDHIVAGGISAGMGADDTMIKEAGEEAGIPPSLAAQAQRVGRLRYDMERGEGLRRDLLYCYDLVLPADFTPMPSDGEVEAFELWPIERAVKTVRDTDHFKFNVNLVLIDLFLRRSLIAPAEAAHTLRHALDQPA